MVFWKNEGDRLIIAYHGVNSGRCPNEKTRVHASGIFKDACWTDENSGTDNGTYDDGDAVEKRHFRLQLDLVIGLFGSRDRIIGPLLIIFNAP